MVQSLLMLSLLEQNVTTLSPSLLKTNLAYFLLGRPVAKWRQPSREVLFVIYQQ